MGKPISIALCAALLAIVGLWLGYTILGPSVRTLIAALAGAAAGFYIGSAAWQVVSLWQSARQSNM
jgi:hypothetical protein